MKGWASAFFLLAKNFLL
jgi:hypothetical protein